MSEPEEIYVSLLNEGINVWRPVKAEMIGPDLFRLLGPMPESELWQFPPNTVVRCVEREFSDGTRAITAVEIYKEEPTQSMLDGDYVFAPSHQT